MTCSSRAQIERGEHGVLVRCDCGWHRTTGTGRQARAAFQEHRWYVQTAAARAAGTFEPRPARGCPRCGGPLRTGSVCARCARA